MKKLAVVASHPIQYWAPVYRELALSSRIEIKVFYVAENGATEYYDSEFDTYVKWDRPLTEGYPYEVLQPGNLLEKFSFFAVDSLELIARLREYSPDCILINGYGQRIAWRTLKYAKATGSKLFYISDSNGAEIKLGFKHVVKLMFLRYFFSCISHFLVVSPRNEAYLLRYGAGRKKFRYAPLPTDIKWLKKQADQLSQAQLNTVRKGLKIPLDHKIILFVGKLIPRKRPQDIIEMLGAINNEKVSLLMIGSGSIGSDLKVLSARLELEERVKFLGFVNQAELPVYMKLSDIFVFPSSNEPYGLVSSEVLPFGLPIVAANKIGAVGASIREGENALLYSCGDVQGLTTQVSKILDSQELNSRMVEASKVLADNFDSSVLANKIVEVATESSEP